MATQEEKALQALKPSRKGLHMSAVQEQKAKELISDEGGLRYG